MLKDEPNLSLYDKKDQKRVVLGGGRGPMLGLIDEKGGCLASL